MLYSRALEEIWQRISGIYLCSLYHKEDYAWLDLTPGGTLFTLGRLMASPGQGPRASSAIWANAASLGPLTQMGTPSGTNSDVIMKFYAPRGQHYGILISNSTPVTWPEAMGQRISRTPRDKAKRAQKMAGKPTSSVSRSKRGHPCLPLRNIRSAYCYHIRSTDGKWWYK